jgi:MFS family permease
MWRHYFTDRNYFAFYLHSFGDTVGSTLASVFTGAFFYSVGMPLYLILLFFGFEFGLRGALAPLGPTFFSRFGITKTICISYGFFIIYFIVVGIAPFSLAVAFFAFIFQSISRAIYYPCVDALHSVLVHEESRGRQYSLENALSLIAGLVAVALGTLALSHYSFWFLAGGAALSLAIAAYGASLFRNISQGTSIKFQDSYRYLFSEEYRPYAFPVAGYALAIIANIIIAPLFVFIRVGTFETFGIIIGLSIAIQMFIFGIVGAVVDRRNPKTSSWVTGLQALGNLAYPFMGTNPVAVFFVNAYNTNSWNALRNTYEPHLQRDAKRSGSPFLFMSSVQMNLCFMEIIALSLFALVAFLWGATAFAIIFGASIVGLWVAQWYLFGKS